MTSDQEAMLQPTRFESDVNEPGTQRLRVIVLTHGGAERVLQRLVALETVRVVGVFVETDIVRRYSFREKLRRSVRYDGYPATMAKLVRRVFLGDRENEDVMSVMQSRDELANLAKVHGVPFHLVSSYHTPESIELIRLARSDLAVIYGTNIIKESVFKIPRLGSINLHQGLAPYYRGGPPIFWELYNDESEVGLTVHFVETNVDSGAIILQDTVPLRYDFKYGVDYESFIADFSNQLRDRCAELVAEAARLISLGTADPKPQDSSLGRRYRLPLKVEKDELQRRLQVRQRLCVPQSLGSADSGRSDETSHA